MNGRRCSARSASERSARRRELGEASRAAGRVRFASPASHRFGAHLADRLRRLLRLAPAAHAVASIAAILATVHRHAGGAVLSRHRRDHDRPLPCLHCSTAAHACRANDAGDREGNREQSSHARLSVAQVPVAGTGLVVAMDRPRRERRGACGRDHIGGGQPVGVRADDTNVRFDPDWRRFDAEERARRQEQRRGEPSGPHPSMLTDAPDHDSGNRRQGRVRRRRRGTSCTSGRSRRGRGRCGRPSVPRARSAWASPCRRRRSTSGPRSS